MKTMTSGISIWQHLARPIKTGIAILGVLIQTGCVTPSWDLGFVSYEIWAKNIDPRFPRLVASQHCYEPCEKPYKSYRITHLEQNPSTIGRDENVTAYYSDPYFDKPLKDVLLPSYSSEPNFRALTVVDEFSNGSFSQIVNFYYDSPNSSFHHLIAHLPITYDCTDRWTREQKDPHAHERKNIEFIVTIKDRAYFFISAKAAHPECADMAIRDVLGDVKGFPDNLYNAKYMVYWAELGIDTDSHASAHARRVTPKFIPAYPENLSVQADPAPDFDGQGLEPLFSCLSSEFRTDWTTTLHVSATSRGTPSYNRQCLKYKPKK